MIDLKKIIIITGHYGSGKTNISANLALYLVEFGSVSVVDLDIVNPFFRVADFGKLFADRRVNLIASKYANSSLDIPALGISIAGAVKTSDYTIIDVGGDDEGAKALGRYRDELDFYLINQQIDMLCVVNKYRYHTGSPNEAVKLLRGIETVSGIKCTGIINNSHLAEETTAELIEASLPYAREIAEETRLPLVFTAGKRELNCAAVDFPVVLLVKPVWL